MEYQVTLKNRIGRTYQTYNVRISQTHLDPPLFQKCQKRKKTWNYTPRKRSSSSSRANAQNINSGSDVPGQYQILLERWKRNWSMGSFEMERFIQRGSKGFNNGWGLVKHSIVNLFNKV